MSTGCHLVIAVPVIKFSSVHSRPNRKSEEKVRPASSLSHDQLFALILSASNSQRK